MATNGNHKLNVRMSDHEREEITAAAAAAGLTAADLVRGLLAQWMGVPDAPTLPPSIPTRCRRPLDTTCLWHPVGYPPEVPRCGEAGPDRDFCDEPVPDGYCPEHGEVGASAPPQRVTFIDLAGRKHTYTVTEIVDAMRHSDKPMSEADVMIAEGWTPAQDA